MMALCCAATMVLPQIASAQAAGQATAAAKPRAYRINPGDELEIYVWGEERLSRDIKVLPDGTFSEFVRHSGPGEVVVRATAEDGQFVEQSRAVSKK